MASRKIVLMIQLAGQKRRQRHKEQTCGHSGGRRARGDLREEHWNLYIYNIDNHMCGYQCTCVCIIFIYHV